MIVLQDLQENTISKSELFRVKESMLGGIEMLEESPTAEVSWWGNQMEMGCKLRSFEQISQLIEQVTVGDIQQLAHTVWNQKKISLVYVGPESEGKNLIDWWHKKIA